MENSQIIKWNLSEEGARTFFRLLFHNFFHKFFRYFFQCIFLCKKFLKNSQFFCIAQRFSPKKVKYFQDFFPTVNNTVKFGGIFCTAYIFSNISGKTYREIGGKNFWNFWVANIVVNFCSIFLHCICSLLCNSYFKQHTSSSHRNISFCVIQNLCDTDWL